MGAKASLLILLLASLVLGLLRSERTAGVVGSLAGAGAGQVVHISFWNGFTGPDGRIMLALVRKFNQMDTQAHVTMQRIPWATYYNKVMVSAMDGRGPEVFVLQADLVPRMHRAGFLDVVNDLYGPGAELKNDYSRRLLDLVDVGEDGHEQLVGVPLDIWPHGLYYNPVMFEQAGVVDEQGRARPPQNADEFLRAAAAIKKDLDGDGRADVWGFGFGHWRYNFMSLAPQFGGRYVNEQGEPTLDHPGNVAALQFLADLNLKYGLAPPPEGGIAGWVGFRQQRVAMVFDGIYMLGDLKRLEGHPYRGAPIPQIGPQPGAFADSHILCIRKGLSASRRAAAARFIRFLADHSLEWADAGQIPARSSVRQSPAFAQLKVQYEFAKQLDYVMYPPKTPSISEFFLHLDTAVEKAIRGRASAAEALRQANLDYKRYLDRDRMERNLLAGPQPQLQEARR